MYEDPATFCQTTELNLPETNHATASIEMLMFPKVQAVLVTFIIRPSPVLRSHQSALYKWESGVLLQSVHSDSFSLCQSIVATVGYNIFYKVSIHLSYISGVKHSSDCKSFVGLKYA